MAGDDVARLLQRELIGATEQAQLAEGEAEKVLAALDRFAALIVAVDNTRLAAASETKKLIEAALRAGVDPRDLYGRPFSNTVVREIAGKLGIKLGKRGPRPRRLPPGYAVGGVVPQT